MKAKKKKMYAGGGKTPIRKNVTRSLKERDEDEIDNLYTRAVGINSKTGKDNYPIGLDMDKREATAGMAGNPEKLRKAISDKYYEDKRKKMGLDKIKTYKKGGKMTESLKALFAKNPKLKKKFGYAKYGMKVKK